MVSDLLFLVGLLITIAGLVWWFWWQPPFAMVAVGLLLTFSALLSHQPRFSRSQGARDGKAD